MRRALWQRLDLPGIEWCEWEDAASGSALRGVALVSLSDEPWRIDYALELDAQDRARRVVLAAQGPQGDRRVEVLASGRGSWTVNAARRQDLDECLDVDLGFSAATKPLPVWRLGLGVGESRDLDVALLTFPALELRRTRLSYRRVAEARYVYRSGPLQAELVLDADGLVESCDGGWRAMASGRARAA